MSKSPLAPITPSVLRWARLEAGLTIDDLAKAAGVQPERYRRWESGAEQPTVAKLRNIAQKCRRPSAVFFLPQPPKSHATPPDFRHLPAGAVYDWPPVLRAFIRYVRYRQTWASEQRRAIGEPPVIWLGRYSTKENPEAVGASLRQLLGVSVEEQTSWSAAAVLRNWRRHVERLGVLVFQSGIRPEWKIDVADMRGLALLDDYAPVIALNGSDSDNARVFTLMHEMAHLAIRAEAVSGWVGSPVSLEQSTFAHREIETFCNRVAGAVLLPVGPLRDAAKALPRPHEPQAGLVSLARRFGVSLGTVATRLRTLGVVNDEWYQAQMTRLAGEWAARPRESSGEGGPPPQTTTVARHGSAFTRMVIDAYGDERASARDVEALLGVNLARLAKVDEAAGGGAVAGGAP